MDTERMKRVLERVYGPAAPAEEKKPPDALREALRYLPAAQTVSFPACPWSETEKNALRAEFPAVAFVWPVAIFGDIYPSDTAELSFAGRTFSEADVAELSEKLASLPKLTRVDLTGTGVTVEQMTPVCEKYPAVDFVFTFELAPIPALIAPILTLIAPIVALITIVLILITPIPALIVSILALIATIPFGPALILFLADTPSFLYRLHLQPFSSSCFLSSYYLI